MLPALAEARRPAGEAPARSNLRQIGLGFDMYRGDYSDIYPYCAWTPYTKDENGRDVWLWMGRGWRPVLEPYIAPNLSVKNPPSSGARRTIRPSTNTRTPATPIACAFTTSPAQINAMNNTSSTYSNPQPGAAGIHGGQGGNPARKILAGEWFSNHRLVTGDYATEPGWWEWAGTRNFLFADGHAEFVPAKKIKPANDGFPDPNLTADGVEGATCKA